MVDLGPLQRYSPGERLSGGEGKDLKSVQVTELQNDKDFRGRRDGLLV